MPYTKWYKVVDLDKIKTLEKMIPVEHSLLSLEQYVFPLHHRLVLPRAQEPKREGKFRSLA